MLSSGTASEATLYGRKSKYGRMEVREAQRLRGREEEDRRLKQLVADPSLDKEALKAIARKNGRDSGERLLSSKRGQVAKPTGVQTFVAQPSVEALHVSVSQLDKLIFTSKVREFGFGVSTIRGLW